MPCDRDSLKIQFKNFLLYKGPLAPCAVYRLDSRSTYISVSLYGVGNHLVFVFARQEQDLCLVLA